MPHPTSTPTHVLITDSGVGGLSVCAYAERFLRTSARSRQPVRLTFANAAPENDYGYNSMRSRDEKLTTFDRFLRNVTQRYRPDSVYVACNTLSVLLPDVPFVGTAAIPVRGMLETTVELLLRQLQADPATVIILFGTPTTIETGTYRRLLTRRGVDPTRIISQACPGLADTISEDRQGEQAAAEILHWVRSASERRSGSPSPVLACLACTHYGYRKELFSKAFEQLGIAATVVDPNEAAAGDLFPASAAGGEADGGATVEIVTRYALPATTLETLTFFLEDISPRTVHALRHLRHVPDLF